MHIIALGWIYVVFMMAITEKSVVAGIVTFTFYCALPLGLVWYLVSAKKRKLAAHRKIQELHRQNTSSTIPRDDTGNSNDNSMSQN